MSDPLAPREAQIMNILWEGGEATAGQVRGAIPGKLHDSTVRTLLRVMEAKGYVKHRLRGRTFIYEPAVAREKVEGRALTTLLQRFFGGSPRALVLRLIADEHITPRELEELRTMHTRTKIETRSKRRKGGAR